MLPTASKYNDELLLRMTPTCERQKTDFEPSSPVHTSVGVSLHAPVHSLIKVPVLCGNRSSSQAGKQRTVRLLAQKTVVTVHFTGSSLEASTGELSSCDGTWAMLWSFYRLHEETDDEIVKSRSIDHRSSWRGIEKRSSDLAILCRSSQARSRSISIWCLQERAQH